MPTVYRVTAGTMPASGRRTQPDALDFDAVIRARIPQTATRPGYTGVRAGATLKTPAIYAAARSGGFRYPNQFKEPGPGRFWVAKHAKDTTR
ncbi:MAG: hypothetical protein RJA99_3203 [Pseudomonadota bacterium]|jgi:hypothetical protein